MCQQTAAIEQLVPGRLETTTSTAEFDSVLMSHVSSNLPAVMHIRGLPGWASYVLPEPTHSSYCNGIRCVSEHCLVLGSNMDVELVCRAPANVIVCRIGASHTAWSHFQRGTCRLAGNADEVFRIRAMISSLHGPHEVTSPDLRDSLAELSLALETDGSSSPYQRTMSIERGRRYIHANFSGALRIAYVCEAAGLRARALEYGFRELFGISPVSYIKAVRLNHARQLLLSPAAAGRTVTAMALDSGFWHLSQFAADYQKFFGESPSATRRRARCQQPAPLRETRSASGF